jgi:alkanesulfonate monooxygenase SsuD/methylene tetrahydromethanopterin reductase-like flavin-dependent oxidoreductase (luciferase family)
VQVTRGIYVAPSDEQAWREAERGVRAFMRATGRPGDDADLRELGRRGDFIVGSPETCAAAIRALAQAAPITDLACDIFLPGMEYGLVERSLELLGQAAERLAPSG